MATKTDRILSYLPETFLTGPGGSVLRSVVDAFGRELLTAENSLAALMRSHWVDHADKGAAEIDDLARIAALYGLGPRPDEGVEEFREHLKRYVRTFLEGATTVQGVLRVSAEALGLVLADEVDELDSWWRRRGSAAPADDPRPFVTRARVAGEAADTLLGVGAVGARGRAAQPARLVGSRDLSRTADLSAGGWLRIAFGGDAARDVLVAGDRPRATTLEEITGALNAAFPHRPASHDGRYLILAAPGIGAASRIRLSPPLGLDALAPLGLSPGTTQGAGAAGGEPARPARVVGEADLSSGLDLGHDRVLRLEVDGEEVDLPLPAAAGATPAQKVVDAINQRFDPPVASLEDGHLVLTSGVTGRAGSVVLLHHEAGDVRSAVFGSEVAAADGREPEPAVLRGEIDLTRPVDLEERRYLRLAVNGAEPRDLDAAGLQPSRTFGDEAVAALNGEIPGLASLDAEGRLVLTSPTAGADSRLEVLGMRHLEVEEYPPVPAAQSSSPRHGDLLTFDNHGAAEAVAEVEILAPRGTLDATLAGADGSWRLRLRRALGAGSAVRLQLDGAGLPAAEVILPGGAPAAVSPAALEVSGAGAPLRLPRGRSRWLYTECTVSRFDEDEFGEARFAGEPCSEWAVFDVSRLAADASWHRSAEGPLALFAPSDPPPDPPVEVTVRWPSRRPGAFVVRLPADLAPRWGGRFGEVRFAGEGPEIFPDAVTEPADDPRHVARLLADGGPGLEPPLAASRWVTASVVDFVPLGHAAVPMGFRSPRPLVAGRPLEAARIYLSEEGLAGFLEIVARDPGDWGAEITVAARRVGTARYEIAVDYRGGVFENARQAVTGTPLPSLADRILAPGPVGVLQAKAAGIRAEVRRERAELADEGPVT